MTNNIQTTQHLIAYLDVLGASRKLCTENNIDFINKLSTLYREHEVLAQWGLNVEQIQIVTFSDNMLLSLPLHSFNSKEDWLIAAYDFLIYVMLLQLESICYGFFLRGAIKTGELFTDMKRNFVAGKGLVEVYQQEQEIAIYPRVVVQDNDFIKDILGLKRNNTALQSQLFKKDHDGIIFLNFLALNVLPQGLMMTQVYRDIKIYYEKLIAPEATTLKIKQKHQWFVTYFNQFCKQYNLSECQIKE